MNYLFLNDFYPIVGSSEKNVLVLFLFLVKNISQKFSGVVCYSIQIFQTGIA